jgi:leucyl/phenylalanyl-tRNA--protein transferase
MRSIPLYWFAMQRYADDFPPVSLALSDPDGLLAAGGDLGVERLLKAYRSGIFPWYSEGQPILWWSPDPRCVIFPGFVHISRSLQRTLKRAHFRVTIDQDFDAVVGGCAAPRRDGGGTWLSPEMQTAYRRLFEHGHAHSVECWREDKLVGGLYGVAIGRIFYGESMFSRMSDASKICLTTLAGWLARWNYQLLDCQVHNPHLETLGAKLIARDEFIEMLERCCDLEPAPGAWRIPVTP